MPPPVRSRTTAPAGTTTPSVPAPASPSASNRQYATVPLGITAFAGRGGGGVRGANPAKRASKSISMLNRSTGPVSSRFSASSGVRSSGSRSSSHGDSVSTSITFRTRSKAYNRTMPAPP
ncbi:hypothetical protein ACTMTI_51675 [Nonomuraea sp. H19]|uniref:hypothetical protein n=1 Tax=Nonomuraea sp. H19 TaxID=3452206 RepID=UPI003F89BBD2